MWSFVVRGFDCAVEVGIRLLVVGIFVVVLAFGEEDVTRVVDVGIVVIVWLFVMF